MLHERERAADATCLRLDVGPVHGAARTTAPPPRAGALDLGAAPSPPSLPRRRPVRPRLPLRPLSSHLAAGSFLHRHDVGDRGTGGPCNRAISGGELLLSLDPARAPLPHDAARAPARHLAAFARLPCSPCASASAPTAAASPANAAQARGAAWRGTAGRGRGGRGAVAASRAGPRRRGSRGRGRRTRFVDNGGGARRRAREKRSAKEEGKGAAAASAARGRASGCVSPPAWEESRVTCGGARGPLLARKGKGPVASAGARRGTGARGRGGWSRAAARRLELYLGHHMVTSWSYHHHAMTTTIVDYLDD